MQHDSDLVSYAGRGGDGHGRSNRGAMDGCSFWKSFSMLCVALASFLWTSGEARAELRLYISDGVNFLEVVDNNNSGSDTDARLGFINVSDTALSTAFTALDFDVVTGESSLGVDNTDRPVRRLNLQFKVFNLATSSRNIEIKALYTGGLDDPRPTEMNFFANGTTYQNYPDPQNPPAPLDIRFAGTFNQNENDSYETNDYLDESGPPFWTLGAQGNDLDFEDIGENGERSFQVVEPYSTMITPDGLYSLTLASKVFALGKNEGYGFQADLEIVLPEPVSSVAWVLLGGSVVLHRARRRIFRIG